MVDAGIYYWSGVLQEIVEAGFDAVEISTTWLPVGEMSSVQREELEGLLASLGVKLVGIGVARKSVIDPIYGEENLGITHRVVDAAAALGCPVVCLGLHPRLGPADLRGTYFWTQGTAKHADDREDWKVAETRLREVADHAASVGVEISLELYEGTYLGDARMAVRLLEGIGRTNVGLNPDIGNLVRIQEATASWEVIASICLPHANYWHVKNYMRLEVPSKGIYVTSPCRMMDGIINYRKAVRYALECGFRGPFVTEHYGGDGLSVSGSNRDYLRSLLPGGLDVAP
jgi:sugar phosphate isomerase/epimerase